MLWGGTPFPRAGFPLDKRIARIVVGRPTDTDLPDRENKSNPIDPEGRVEPLWWPECQPEGGEWSANGRQNQSRKDVIHWKT